MLKSDFYRHAPLAVQIILLGHEVNRLVERQLGRLDCNHTQAAVMGALRWHPGLMAQDLAAFVRVEPPNITRALQALERRGLVERRPHPTDGRASLFTLTEVGQEASANLARLLWATSTELEEVVEPEGRAALREALGAMLSHFQETRREEV